MADIIHDSYVSNAVNKHDAESYHKVMRIGSETIEQETNMRIKAEATRHEVVIGIRDKTTEEQVKYRNTHSISIEQKPKL